MAEPKKAYYVERVIEVVTTSLVYADSAADAKARVTQGQQEWTEADDGTGKGTRSVRRAPDEDRGSEQA